MAINITALEGRLTRHPEVRKTEAGISVMQFSLAVPRRIKRDGQPEADFINCVAWRQAADFLGKYAHQGDMISLQGRLTSRSYEKDGKKIYTTEVVCDSVSIVAFKKQDQIETQQSVQQNYQQRLSDDADRDMFGGSVDISQDDLPFM